AELLSRFSPSRLREPQVMGGDYLYDVNQMIHLSGSELSSKRQAKNRFLRNYAHRVETYSAPAHLQDCVSLLASWKDHQDASHATEIGATAIKRQKESLATELALRHADELGLRGLVVYVTGEDGQQRLRGF